MNSKRMIALLVSISTLIVLLLGTYAMFKYISPSANVNITADMGVEYEKGTNILSGTLNPSLDKLGGINTTISLWKTNTALLYGNLYMDITTLDTGLNENNQLKWELYSNDQKLSQGSLKEKNQNDTVPLLENIILQTTSQDFTIYLWLDDDEIESTSIINRNISVTIKATVGQIPIVNETIPNTPALADGMIPVKYNETTSKWEKADSTNTSNDWYDYENKKWANVVMVTTETRSTYTSANNETEINNNDILGFFVWIPRYKYQLFNVESNTVSPRQISVVFQKTTDAVITGNTNGAWLTHPAFWWDDDNDGVREIGEELSGIWVAKFETTGNATNPTVVPNVRSLRDQRVSDQFVTARKFGTTDYITTPAQTDAHMMKNMEWGCAAIFTQSEYGRCTSGTCTEVYLNNSSSYYTGRSMNAVGGAGETIAEHYNNASYETTEYYTYGYYTYDDYPVLYGGQIGATKELGKGTGASTTGNVYGIYDMSGSSLEYVMGALWDENSANPMPRSGYSARTYSAGDDGEAKRALNRTDYVGIYNSGFYGLIYGKDTNDGGLTYTVEMYVTEANANVTTTTGGMAVPEKKYYDLYNGEYIVRNRKIGDATGETRGWYGDHPGFAIVNYPWFRRGGAYYNGAGAGLFASHSLNGHADNGISFRVVLTPSV